MELRTLRGMGGKEAIAKSLELDPDVRAVVSSGHSNDNLMANYSEYGFRDCIWKAFNLKEIDRLLKSLL